MTTENETSTSADGQETTSRSTDEGIAVRPSLLQIDMDPHPGTGARPSLLDGTRSAAGESTSRWTPLIDRSDVPGQPSRAPLSPRAKRRPRRVVSIVGAAGVLLVAGFIAVGVANATRGPDGVVRTYVEALAKGDATSATKSVDPGIPSDQRTLLTDAALKQADHRLSVQSVRTVSTQGDSASVEAVLAVDGQRFTHTFTVHRGANDFAVLNTWVLSEPLLSRVTVGASAHTNILMGDIKVPLIEGSENDYGYKGSVWVYPGTYTFTAASNKYMTPVPATVSVLAGSAGSDPTSQPDAAIVRLTPNDALKQFVLAQAQDRVMACATVPTNVDDICPYAVRSKDLTALSLMTQVTAISEITMTSFETDEATITTQSKPTFGITPAPQNSSFSLRGTITFKNGEPTVTFTRNGWY